MVSPIFASAIFVLLQGQVLTQYSPIVHVELHSRVGTLYERFTPRNGQSQWIEIKLQQPVTFYNQKTIFWQSQDSYEPPTVPIQVQIKLTCAATYFTKWVVNSEYQNTEEPETSTMNYNVKLLARGGEDVFAQKPWQNFNVTELWINSFGPLFQSGTVDCIKHSDPTVKSQLYIFQKYDQSYKPFKDSLSASTVKLPLSQKSIPCKVHDPDLTPQLKLLRQSKVFTVNNHDYNFNVGFTRTVGLAGNYALHDEYTCSFSETVFLRYTFVSDSEVATSTGDENNISIDHVISNDKLIFTCKSVDLAPHVDSFTPQSMRLQYCRSPNYCDSGSPQQTMACPSQSVSDCEIMLGLKMRSWLNVNGQISCTATINDKSYRKTNNYFFGLRNNYYLLNSDQSVPPEEVIELAVQQSVNANAITVITFTCKALTLFTFPSMKIFVTYADASRPIPVPTGEVKLYAYYMIAENVQVTLTDQMHSISCHVPLYNSTEWLVAYHHFNWSETTPLTSAPTSAVSTTTLPPTLKTTVTASSSQTAAASPPSTILTTIATTTTKGTPPSNTTTTTTTTTTASTTKETTTTTQRPTMAPFAKHADVENNSTVIVSLVFVGVLLVVVIIFVTIYQRKVKTLQQKIRQLSDEEIQMFFDGSRKTNPNPSGYAFVESQPFNKDYEIACDQLEIFHDQILGSGEFGLVFRGKFKSTPGSQDTESTLVAVKTVKPNVDVTYFMALLTELKVMCYIGRHENIASLLGASTTRIRTREVYIALEFCAKGDLLGYLKKNRASFQDLLGPLTAGSTNLSSITQTSQAAMNTTETTTFTVVEVSLESKAFSTMDLVNWSHQIAQGMAFIGLKNVIHGDLAARNVLLTAKNVAKISDFGLSRQLHNYSVYKKTSKTPLPWKWMAIESLRDMQFFIQSDVWAFGVTLFEIFSLGTLPYPGQTWTLEFVDELVEGLRLNSPKYGNEDIFNLMLDCMKLVPDERITFSDIIHKLQEIKTKLVLGNPNSSYVVV